MPCDLIMTQIPCDLPYFIKTGSLGFNKTYNEFLTKRVNTSRFLIGASPKKFQDVMLVPQKINYFFDTVVSKSKNYFETFPLFITTKREFKTRKLNTFLSPLLFSHNNVSLNLPVVVSGYPYIQQIDYMARRIKPADLTRLYETGKFKRNIRNTFDDFINSNRSLFYDASIRYNYELIFEASRYYNNIVAFVCTKNIEEITDLFLKERTGNEPTIEELVRSKTGNPLKLSFSNYLKNLVVLDAVYDKYLNDYFWPNKIFPFIVDETMPGYDYGKLFTPTLIDHFSKGIGASIIDLEKERDEVESLEKLFEDKLDN